MRVCTDGCPRTVGVAVCMYARASVQTRSWHHRSRPGVGVKSSTTAFNRACVYKNRTVARGKSKARIRGEYGAFRRVRAQRGPRAQPWLPPPRRAPAATILVVREALGLPCAPASDEMEVRDGRKVVAVDEPRCGGVYHGPLTFSVRHKKRHSEMR